jgi:hypothetical protein
MKTLFTSLFIAFSAIAGEVNYTNTMELDPTYSGFKIDQAEYFELATETVRRPIPGCAPWGERHPSDCEEEVATKREAVVRVWVDFEKGYTGEIEDRRGSVAFNFKLSDFAAADVAALKKASPLWRPFGYKARKNFAKKYFSVAAQRVKKDIKIVDVRKSKLCTYQDDRYPETIPGCKEVIVYKDSFTFVKTVTVSKK